MSLKEGIAVGVVRVKRLGGHRLELTFSDGHVSVIDLGPFLRSALNPETRRFLDVKRFSRFSLVHGNLVWGDYEMCFPIEDLYEGQIVRVRATGDALAVAEGRAEYATRKRRRVPDKETITSVNSV